MTHLVPSVLTLLALATPLQAQTGGWLDFRMGPATAAPYGTPPSSIDDFRRGPVGPSELCGQEAASEAACTVDGWGLALSGGWRVAPWLGLGGELFGWLDREELNTRIWREHNTRSVAAILPVARLYLVPGVPVYATGGLGLGVLRAADEWTQIDNVVRDKTAGLAVAYGGGATIPLGRWGIELSGLWLRLPDGIRGRHLSFGLGYHW